jgi:hypothetical protein
VKFPQGKMLAKRVAWPYCSHIIVQSARTVSRFALRSPSWKQADRAARINIKTEARGIPHVTRVRCQRGGNHTGKASISEFGRVNPSSIDHRNPL